MKLYLIVFLFLFSISILNAQFAAPVGPQNITLNTANQIRGYHFTATTSFTICGLYIPDDNSSLPQNIEVVRFTNGAPPAWIMTTNDFVSLFYISQYAINDTIPCSIPVAKGDIIGVYGARGNTTLMYNSLSTPNYVSNIYGKPVTFIRSGMNSPLHNQQMKDIFSEQSQEIGRISMRYHCCEPPKPDFIYGPSEVCMNIPYSFYIDSSYSATQYIWSAPPGATLNNGQGTDTVSITFTNAITDTLWVKAVNGCDTSLVEYKVVSSLPIIPTITYNWPELISSLAPSYQWYVNGNLLPGEIFQTHTPTQNGNYEVEIDTLGCKYKSALYAFGSFSIEEWIEKNTRLYPVPAKDAIYIEFSEKLNSENKGIEIFDILGNLVFKGELNSTLNRISVSQLQAGIYFTRIKSGHYSFIKKMVLE
ncbi:MAG: T9SS type A sorting domain-containing protein [Flavobacteriales bacterium]|nr:T9SS type A sorting domain-containing protein [Flavobacteriales bacterium]